MRVASSYRPGAYNVTADAPPALAMGRNFDRYLSELGQWQRQRFMDRSRPVGRARGATRPMLGGRGVTVDRAAEGRADLASEDREFELERRRKAAAFEDEQRAARTGQQPLKLVTMAGQTFYVPDSEQMTGLQREVFLPEKASFADPSAEAAAGAAKEKSDQSEWDKYLASANDPYGTIKANAGGTKNPGYGGADPQDSPGTPAEYSYNQKAGGMTPYSTALPIGTRR